MAYTAEENADNFQDFFENLLANEGDRSRGLKQHERMKKKENEIWV